MTLPSDKPQKQWIDEVWCYHVSLTHTLIASHGRSVHFPDHLQGTHVSAEVPCKKRNQNEFVTMLRLCFSRDFKQKGA